MPIRPATTHDAEAIARVHVASWQAAYAGILPVEYLAGLSVERRRTMWAVSIAKGMPHILVAVVDDQPVGFSAFGPCRDEGASPGDFEVWALYLARSHWSVGLGRQLWLASREAAVAQGARQISLWVIAGNRRAITFYEAAGFAPEVNSLKKFELGGVQLEEVRYVQTVQA
jgi:GNAT superfamily N-acetyltransferase